MVKPRTRITLLSAAILCDLLTMQWLCKIFLKKSQQETAWKVKRPLRWMLVNFDDVSWLEIGFGSGQKTVKLKKKYSSDWIFCPKWKHWLPLYMEIKIILLGAFWSIIKTDLEKVKHKNYINYEIKRWIYFGNYCYSVWKLLLAKVYKRLMLPVVLNAFKMYSVTLREENYKFWIVLVIIQFKNSITHMIYKMPDIKIQILSSCRLGFAPRSVHVGLWWAKWHLDIFFRELFSSPVSIIPPGFHTHINRPVGGQSSET
jgi:hypothetical protein